MPPDLWLPEAIKVPGNNGLRQGAGGGRGKRIHTHHTFEAPYTLGTVVACRYLNSKGSTSHFTFNPVTGEIGQMLPMDQAARTLAATTAPGYDVNRHGDVHAQTEVIAYAARPWTLDLTAAGMRGLILWMNFLRSWGIPDQWAWEGQPPPVYPGPGVRRRMPDRSGHAYHAGWPVPPGVTPHGDPGAIAAPWTLAGTVRPSPAPPPRVDEWPTGYIREIQDMLNAVTGSTLDLDDSLGPLTTTVVVDYQTARGLDPDGKPGTLTRTALEADMATLQDIATVTLRKAAADTLGVAPGDYDLGWVLEVIVRNTVQAKRYALAAMRNEVDPSAVADALREDVTRAVTEAGSGATADQIVDALLARLTATQEG